MVINVTNINADPRSKIFLIESELSSLSSLVKILEAKCCLFILQEIWKLL